MVDLGELRERCAREVARRAVAGQPGAYAQERGGPPTLYGTTAAVNVYAILGLPVTAAQREAWLAVILRHQDASGRFAATGPAHALCMALQALNLLAAPIPPNVAPLAPRDPAALPAWLAAHDWGSTHKELWGSTGPLLATGLVSPAWTAAFTGALAARLDPAAPSATWCRPDDPPWKVISCLYHVLEAFDAGALPYPQPDLLLDRLLGLDWPAQRATARQTTCTDGDWAWLLAELGKLRPARWPAACAAIRAVSAQRAAAWTAGAVDLAALSTHDLFCHLWVTAAFQRLVREDCPGPCLRDTQNEAALLRLGRLGEAT